LRWSSLFPNPDSVIAQVLIEEKSRNNPTAQTALLAHGGKGKGKDKGDKGKKKCAYCKKKGQVKDECRRLKAARRSPLSLNNLPNLNPFVYLSPTLLQNGLISS